MYRRGHKGPCVFCSDYLLRYICCLIVADETDDELLKQMQYISTTELPGLSPLHVLERVSLYDSDNKINLKLICRNIFLEYCLTNNLEVRIQYENFDCTRKGVFSYWPPVAHFVNYKIVTWKYNSAFKSV